MKNFGILTALLLLLPLFAVNAQEKPAVEKLTVVDKKEKLKKPAQKRKELLKMTPEQDDKYSEIMKRYNQKRLALKNDTIMKLEEKHKVVKGYFKDMDAEVQKVLTAEQFAIYKELEDKKRQRMEQMQAKQPKVN
jgi:Spy/CpxP family protein refolding chaperone